MTRNQQTTRFITAEERAERQKADRADRDRRQLDDNPEAYIAKHTLGGHAFQSHVANSPRSLLNNVLSGQKHGDTKFHSAELQTYCMQEVLYGHMRELQDWVATAKNGEQRLFAASFTDPDTSDPEYIGTGFVTTSTDKTKPYSGQNRVNYIESNCAAIVIKKNPDAPDNWEITTAFPMSHPRSDVVEKTTDIHHTDKNFKNLMRQTQTYQEANPVRKLALDLKASGGKPNPRFNISYHEATDRLPDAIIIKDTKNLNKPAIKITENPDSQYGVKLSLHSYGRPDIVLDSLATQKIARETVPELYQHCLNLVKANTGPAQQQAPTHPRPPTAQSGHSVADMQLRNSPDASPRREY